MIYVLCGWYTFNWKAFLFWRIGCDFSWNVTSFLDLDLNAIFWAIDKPIAKNQPAVAPYAPDIVEYFCYDTGHALADTEPKAIFEKKKTADQIEFLKRIQDRIASRKLPHLIWFYKRSCLKVSINICVFQSLKVCLHIPMPCLLPSQCLSKFSILSRSDGQDGSRTQSASWLAVVIDTMLNFDVTVTGTASIRVNRPQVCRNTVPCLSVCLFVKKESVFVCNHRKRVKLNWIEMPMCAFCGIHSSQLLRIWQVCWWRLGEHFLYYRETP